MAVLIFISQWSWCDLYCPCPNNSPVAHGTPRADWGPAGCLWGTVVHVEGASACLTGLCTDVRWKCLHHRVPALTMYMVHMGINQRLDKARQTHPSWLGKRREHIALLLCATAPIERERATGAQGVPQARAERTWPGWFASAADARPGPAPWASRVLPMLAALRRPEE